MTDVPLHAPPSITAGQHIVDVASSLIGIGYSEESPSGSDGDGHDWEPGDARPTRLDCSGLVVVVLVTVGIRIISRGTAQDQWLQHIGGIVHPDDELLPGDVMAFLGANNIRGYAGHTGIVADYSTKTKTGLLINAYDTLRGTCELQFNRLQKTNEMNGLGVVGAYRPANRITG